MRQQSKYWSLIRKLDGHSESTDHQGRHLQLQSQDLKNTRDLRTLLLEAAYELESQPDLADVQIYLHNCTLAKSRVQMEMDQFTRIARPQIGERIQLHDTRNSPDRDHSPIPYFSMALRDISRKPTAAGQEAVVAYLLQRHLKSLPGVSVRTIEDETQASLPTIYKVLKKYAHCIERNPEDKTLRMRYFAQSDWLMWMQRAGQLSSVYFIDRSGAPRSATRLAKQLAKLQREDLAIGGLMGAMHHLPALDATSSPQLDILVHGTRRADLSFITRIDPGLERLARDEERTEMAHVVVHFIDRPNPLFEYKGGHWGSLPDCIANLHKAGLTHQVDDALQLIKQGIKQ